MDGVSLMEKGFYHPDLGYWQTVGGNPSLDDYPEGTIEVPLKPSANHVWQNGGWVYVAHPHPQPTAEELRDHAAQKRWEKEVGGIKLNGLVIHTDDRSKIMISGARVAAEANPNFTTQWKGADGTFVTLDAAMIMAISNAVSTHVSNCFALEAQVLAQIEAGTIRTTAEIDAAFD